MRHAYIKCQIHTWKWNKSILIALKKEYVRNYLIQAVKVAKEGNDLSWILKEKIL